jgi:predicted nucleic acid-binding protein
VTRFVLDASVTLAWLIDRETPPYAMRVRHLLLTGSRASVPALWQWEIANGFVVSERRGVLKPSETAEILHDFEVVRAAIEIKPEVASIPRVIAAARENGLTAYDAAYLDLAYEQQMPIATLDRALVKAANRAGVPLLS